MSSSIENTIWDLDPHTLVKHKILHEYLNRWLPIISKFKKANYIDGFAGPGIYSKGEDGSPIIALKAARDHRLTLNADFNFLFIEARRDRYEVLKNILMRDYSNIPNNLKWYPVHADFESHIDKVLDDIESRGAKLAPTFAFIDPFGFTGFSMNSIKRILSYKSCETFINLMEGFVNRFNDEHRENALDTLYGTDAWREIRGISNSDKRREAWLTLYEKQLINYAGARFTRSFEIINENNQTLYYLIFATKHPTGLYAMKEAMWKVDRTGGYRFSDRTNPNQKILLDYTDERTWISNAADLVARKFKGKKVKLEEIENYILLSPYLYRKSILVKLESDNIIVNVGGRIKKGTFPKGCTITFA